MIAGEVSDFISERTGLHAKKKECMGYMDQIFKARVKRHFDVTLKDPVVTQQLEMINKDLEKFKVDGFGEDFETLIRKNEDNPRKKCEIYSTMIKFTFDGSLKKMIKKLDVFIERLVALRHNNFSNLQKLYENYVKKATGHRYNVLNDQEKEYYNEFIKNLYHYCMNLLSLIKSGNSQDDKIKNLETAIGFIQAKRNKILKVLSNGKQPLPDCDKIPKGLVSNAECAHTGLINKMKIYWSIVSDVAQKNENNLQNDVPNLTSSTIITCLSTMIATNALKQLLGTAIETIVKSIMNILSGGIFIIVSSILWVAKLFKTFFEIYQSRNMIEKSELWGKAAGYAFQIIKSLMGLRKRRLIKKIR